jgi:hypothetical protein
VVESNLMQILVDPKIELYLIIVRDFIILSDKGSIKPLSQNVSHHYN